MISLCIITKGNEEFKQLKRAVESCVKYVNEVCITTTTSFYDDVEKWCKKNKYNHSHFRWNQNFSDARNFNYKQAKYNQFFIDSDDIVLNPENLPELDKMIEEDGKDWILLPYLYAKDSLGRVTARQVKPRLTRNGTTKWMMSVHECLEPTKAISHKVSDLVVVDHQRGEDHDKLNAPRNLIILMDEYKRDGKNTDARTLMYLGNTLMNIGEFGKALTIYMEFLKKSGSNEDKFFVFHMMVDCFFMVGRYKDIIDCGLSMVALYPEWSLGYFDLARGYTLTEEFAKAVEWTLVGMQKERPNSLNFTNDNDYVQLPMGRLADCYLEMHRFDDALDVAEKLYKLFPKDQMVIALRETCKKSVETEEFVTSFIKTASVVRQNDRLKAIKLFECLPNNLDDDIRLQQMRAMVVPPKSWKGIVFYCGKSLEHWAYPSIFSGIGGSEASLIRMSEELTKLGYKVTVFNDCGDMRGNYNGVEYIPYYHFSLMDNYETLISWRNPGLFNFDVHAKKKILWIHDLAYDWQFNDKILNQVDKFIFLSKFHRSNMPQIPDEKIYISNNGIVLDDFKSKVKKRPNSLVWSSSYDRGLLPFIKNIWPLIKKEIPSVTLDVAYGWQNIDKELNIVPGLKELREELTPLLQSEGITHHDRLPQAEMIKLYQSSLCMPYASEFGETNNISSQMAQASGCYVISCPQAGATPEYLKFGELVRGKGIYNDKQQQKRFAEAVVRYLKVPKTPPSGLRRVFSIEETAKGWKNALL